MCNQLINNKIHLWERGTGGRVEGRKEKTATSWLYVPVCVCTVQCVLQPNIDPVVEPKKSISG